MSDELSALVFDQTSTLFERLCGPSVLIAADGGGTWPDALWAAIDEAGLPDALVPDADDGAGSGLRNALAILRAAGAFAAPVPLAETMLARFLLRAPGSGVMSIGFLSAPWATGRSPTGSFDTGVEAPWASVAKQVVFADDRTGDLFAVQRRELTVLRTRRNLAGEPRELVTSSARAPSGKARPGPSPLALFALLRAAQMSGAMQRVLDLTVGYSKDRQQFGRPLAAFQAIQQMLAEAAGHVASTAVAVDLAAMRPSELTFAVSKARASEAVGPVAAMCHQILGAIGYSREFQLHWLTRRLWSWRDEAGDEMFWQARIASMALANGGAANLWAYVTGEVGG